MKKNEERGVGDNSQFPMATELLKAWAILRNKTFKKLSDSKFDETCDMNDRTFDVIDESLDHCLEVGDILDNCLEQLGVLNPDSCIHEDKIKAEVLNDKK